MDKSKSQANRNIDITKKKTSKPPIEEKTLEIMKNILKRDAQYRDKSTLSEDD